MFKELSKLSDREFKLLCDRVSHLNDEITRYRDTEWKATAFYLALLSAFTTILLDEEKRAFLRDWRIGFTLWLVGYAGLACCQLVYIHLRLNRCRNERAETRQRLGESTGKRIGALFGLYEGSGFIFFAGFLLLLVSLAVTLIILLWL
ncbi:MAG: hypothetical protein Q8O92_02185 [Candidatus Latescibacter sp.]|nr:hypothetical protein [Candidatus Latescibacter sp.]